MNKKTASPPPPPRWWAPSASLWVMLGFGALAVVPYLMSATRLASEGKAISMEEMKKDVMKKGEPLERQKEIKGLTISPDGTVYGGGKAGIYTFKDGVWSKVEGFDGHDVKALAFSSDSTLYALHHDGVSARKEGAWKTLYEGPAHNLTTGSDGSVLLATHKPVALLQLQANGSWKSLADGLPLAH